MLKAILLSVGVIGSLVAASGPSRDVLYLGMNECPQGGCTVPIFDKGYMIQMKDYVGAPPDGLTVYDPSGREMFEAGIVAPDGTPGHLRDAAVDTDGTVGIAMSYGGYGGKGHVKGGAIVLVDRNAKQKLLAETGRWLPARICFAPDHSIWVLGTQFAPLHDGDDQDHVQRGDYPLIRKYSSSGKLDGEYLPRSLFPGGLPPGDNGVIRAANDRIGVVTYSGAVANSPEWIELNFDGKLTGRWQLGPQATSDSVTRRMTYYLHTLSLTADARLFAETDNCPPEGRCSFRLVLFDKTTSTWQPAAGTAPALAQDLLNRFRHLVGAAENNLVFEDRTRGVHLLWVPLDGT